MKGNYAGNVVGSSEHSLSKNITFSYVFESAVLANRHLKHKTQELEKTCKKRLYKGQVPDAMEKQTLKRL